MESSSCHTTTTRSNHNTENTRVRVEVESSTDVSLVLLLVCAMSRLLFLFSISSKVRDGKYFLETFADILSLFLCSTMRYALCFASFRLLMLTHEAALPLRRKKAQGTRANDNSWSFGLLSLLIRRIKDRSNHYYFQFLDRLYRALEETTTLSNLRWMASSVSKGFDTAMKTGSSRRFKWYPKTCMWVSSWLPFNMD